MDYKTIIDTALAYADKSDDVDTSSKIDLFPVNF